MVCNEQPKTYFFLSKPHFILNICLPYLETGHLFWWFWWICGLGVPSLSANRNLECDSYVELKTWILKLFLNVEINCIFVCILALIWGNYIYILCSLSFNNLFILILYFGWNLRVTAIYRLWPTRLHGATDLSDKTCSGRPVTASDQFHQDRIEYFVDFGNFVEK